MQHMLNVFYYLFLFIQINCTTQKPGTNAGRIIDKYTWIVYDQDKENMYLMLKSDGTVVLSPLGKFKVTNELQPSASVRQIVDKFIINLENKPICNNGYDLPVSACVKAKKKKHGWEFIKTRYGTLIENEGLCMTKTMQLYEADNPLNEYGLKMYPCDASVEQLFDIRLTNETNWEEDGVY